jgi:hypothetical protein
MAAVQLLLDAGAAVEVVGGLEGKERRRPHDDRPQDLVANVKVVVSEAAPLVRQDAMVGVLGRILGQADREERIPKERNRWVSFPWAAPWSCLRERPKTLMAAAH